MPGTQSLIELKPEMCIFLGVRSPVTAAEDHDPVISLVSQEAQPFLHICAWKVQEDERGRSDQHHLAHGKAQSIECHGKVSMSASGIGYCANIETREPLQT